MRTGRASRHRTERLLWGGPLDDANAQPMRQIGASGRVRAEDYDAVAAEVFGWNAGRVQVCLRERVLDDDQK